MYSHIGRKNTFSNLNSESKLVNEWFLANKFSINAKKKNLFDKVTIWDSFPLYLLTMTVNNIEIKRENSVKFLGVIVDENLRI